MAHVRRGDIVVVIAGKEKGKRGKVLCMLTKKDRVVVERIMMVKRHTRPSQKTPQGGIIEKEGSIHISNVALWCEKCTAPRRAVIKFNEAGGQMRHCKKCDAEFPQAAV
ncbi:MAG: 50S ribosomal protein L24 [Deltaproteobacteria bacterium]|nr:50S ribosomal protein L24 [Deltaproteobacteria bacterium]